MKLKKKIFIIFLIFLMTLAHFSFAAEPQIASTAAILVEESTGKILYQKNR